LAVSVGLMDSELHCEGFADCSIMSAYLMTYAIFRTFALTENNTHELDRNRKKLMARRVPVRISF
jgi:hypothetical protein